MPTFTVYIETDDEARMASLPDRIAWMAKPAEVKQVQGGVWQFWVEKERAPVVRELLGALVGDVRVIEI